MPTYEAAAAPKSEGLLVGLAADDDTETTYCRGVAVVTLYAVSSALVNPHLETLSS